MIRRWYISVPVWGGGFIDAFLATALPTLQHAAKGINDDRRLVIHTDTPEAFGPHSTELLPIETRRLPAGAQWFNCMSRSHGEVLDMACLNDVVVLLTGDMVVSGNAFSACGDAFQSGKKLVACNATRTLAQGMLPFMQTSRKMSEWGWDNRHPITVNSTWPAGEVEDMPRVYFERNGNVAARLWLPHPLAVVLDGRPLPFTATVDCDLIANFLPDEIHLVTSPDELAVLELSPGSKRDGSRDMRWPAKLSKPDPISARYADQALVYEVYRWAVQQRIVVKGADQECGDSHAVASLMANLANASCGLAQEVVRSRRPKQG